MKYGDVTLGQIEAAINRLGGMDGWRRFLAGELVVKPVERVFAVWRTVTIGLATSVAAYITALESAGFKIGDIARQMCTNVSVSAEQVTYDLFVASTLELGFKSGATFAQISTRVVELGYQLCPAEVGLALRLVYTDQPMDESLLIVMEPISVSVGRPNVFRVGRGESGQWLRSSWANPDSVWAPDYLWVFCRPAVVGAGK